ncbi:MAG: methyltransferase dimerization domain-containing protein [Betaproteobacteria bacterium]
MASWSSLRDRLLTSASFRRRVSAIPGLRAISRRQSRKLFDLVAGFSYSQVLLACVRLELFDKLAQGPQSIAQIAQESALPAESADILVRATISLDLLEWRGRDAVGLGMLGAVMVDNPAISALVRHHQAV